MYELLFSFSNGKPSAIGRTGRWKRKKGRAGSTCRSVFCPHIREKRERDWSRVSFCGHETYFQPRKKGPCRIPSLPSLRPASVYCVLPELPSSWPIRRRQIITEFLCLCFFWRWVGVYGFRVFIQISGFVCPPPPSTCMCLYAWLSPTITNGAIVHVLPLDLMDNGSDRFFRVSWSCLVWFQLVSLTAADITKCVQRQSYSWWQRSSFPSPRRPKVKFHYINFQSNFLNVLCWPI